MPPVPPSVPIGIVGAGTMGAGIAEIALRAGHPVLLFDEDAHTTGHAVERIAASLESAIERGKLRAEERDLCLRRIAMCASLGELAPAELVIEAIFEDHKAKRQLLQVLEEVVEDDAILASNTSSLSITALGAPLKRPGRLVGMHFFNPPPVMALVEVVRGLETSPEVVDAVMATAEAWGKTPVLVCSSPGFIVNRVARPFYGEALRALTERAAEPATIDAVMREAGGFRMGPFELMDLIGLDVNLAVSRSVHAACHGDPRYTPSLLQEEMVEAGRLGRKAKRGFYDYTDRAVRPEPRTEPAAPAPTRITIEGDLGLAEPLIERWRGAGIGIERRSGEGLIRIERTRLALTDGRGATLWAHMLDAPVVLFDLAEDYASCTRLALGAADQCEEADVRAAVGLFQAAGIAVSRIDDFPGLLVMRTVCMLANEAAEAVHGGVADARSVDQAMRLGTNYPRGPLEWADAIGPKRVLEVLDHLARTYGDGRYRASWLLWRKVLAETRFHG